MRGTLFLVIGPSGVGKDTLIRAAAARRPDLVVPRRVVTRAADAAGETIESVSQRDFDRLAGQGGFLLHWRAHGLCYGIPAAAGTALEQGCDVLANVSRAAVAEARARLQPVRVLAVTADRATLAARLAARGRETAAEIAGRLDRAGHAMPEGPDVCVIANQGPVEYAVAAFLDALQPVRGCFSRSGDSAG